jgi:hypothetical protein
MFFSKECGEDCREAATSFLAVSHALAGVATAGAVDCADEAGAALCRRLKVAKPPALMLFSPERKANPYTGDWYKESTILSAAPGRVMSGKRLTDAVVRTLDGGGGGAPEQQRVREVKSERELDEWRRQGLGAVGDGSGAAALLLTKKASTPTLFKSLAARLHKRLGFAVARVVGGGGGNGDAAGDGGGDVDKLAAALGVSEFPALVYLPVRVGREPRFAAACAG